MTDKYGLGEAVGCICFFGLIVLCLGEPDLLDAIIKHLESCK